jgi:hypothetical protein
MESCKEIKQAISFVEMDGLKLAFWEWAPYR